MPARAADARAAAARIKRNGAIQEVGLNVASINKLTDQLNQQVVTKLF